jgi:serine-type D-Ala-D-Ala carboxypeptidase
MGGEHARATELEDLLVSGVREGVFPGAVAAVAVLTADGFIERAAWAGTLAPGDREVAVETVYDLASLTKPFVAVTALRLAQRGALDLHEPVVRYLPELEPTPAAESTLALLLSHRAGLAAYGRMFEALAAPPGSAEARAWLLHEAASRSDPASSRSQSVYSDLGYIVAGEAIARASGASLAELVTREVTAPLGLAGRIVYPAALPPEAREALVARVAPTEQCGYRGRLVRGEVHDENAYALGAIAGHAGLFGDARAVLRFGLAVLLALEGRSTWLDRALISWALAPRGAGYVVGWDTKSPEGSSAGARFSERSFGHLGFTGTSIWCDPLRRVCAVLLTNRVHPSRDNIAIRAFRPRFHDAAMALVDALVSG